MATAETLTPLIQSSTIISPEKKAIYLQMLPYFSQEAMDELAVTLEKENEVLAEVNNKFVQDLDQLVRDGLKEAQGQEENTERDNAELLLKQLDTL